MSEEASLDEFTNESEVSDGATDQPEQELIQGVAWSILDHVPQNWEVNNIASDVDLLAGNNFSSDGFVDVGGIPLIRIRDLETDETTVNFAGEHDSKYLIEYGDLLVGMDGEFEPHLWSGPQSLLNQRVCKIEPGNQYNKIFLRYGFVKPLYYIQKSIAGTTVKHLSQSNIKDINLPTPSLEEQRKIATILYTVDQAIQKAEEIIEQAKLVRDGLAQSAFSVGIGSDWGFRDLCEEEQRETRIGKIPDIWGFSQLDNVCSDVVDCLNDTPEYSDDGVLVVLTSEIDDGRYDPDNAPYVSEDVYKERVRRIEPQPGDVVFTREAPIGEAFKIPENTRLCLGQRTMTLRAEKEVLSPDYLLEVLYSEMMQSWFQRVAVGSTSKHMRVEHVEEMKIPVPPVEEQDKIASLLGNYRNEIEAHLEYSSQLKRLKQGLMQDLLSGAVRTHETDIEVPKTVLPQG